MEPGNEPESEFQKEQQRFIDILKEAVIILTRTNLKYHSTITVDGTLRISIDHTHSLDIEVNEIITKRAHERNQLGTHYGKIFVYCLPQNHLS